MRISTEINSSAKKIGEEKAIEYIAKAGFDAWDFSMFRMIDYNWDTGEMNPGNHPLSSNDYLAFARRLRKTGIDCGIRCNQSHAPFPTYAPGIITYLKRAIECTAEAGGEICVIHPDNFKSPSENAELFSKLLPFAKECGVKIATENMWNWDNDKDEATAAACSSHQNFKEHLDTVNDDFFVACLDIGHAEMRGLNTSAPDMIYTLGNKLQALHIHDNDLHHDSHQIPFSMKIDFKKIVKALKDTGYKGFLTLEADRYLEPYSADNIFDGIRNLKDAASKLASMF